MPTVAESGVPGFAVYEWNGLFAPAGTPPAVLQRLETETRAALASADLRSRLAGLGVQPVGSTSADFRRFVQAETTRWSDVIQRAGIRLD